MNAKWRYTYIPRLRKLQQILQAFWHARGGSWFEYGLAVVGVIPDILDMSGSYDEVFAAFYREALYLSDLGEVQEVSRYLRASADYIEVPPTAPSGQPTFFDADGNLVAVLTSSQMFLSNSPIRDDARQHTANITWAAAAGREVRLTVKTDRFIEPTFDSRPPPVHVGEEAEQALARLRMYDRAEARTVLIYGPTGCGKSTLARVIAQERGDRVLSVAADVAMSRAIGDASRLLRMYEPDVMIIDDLDLASSWAGLLALLEQMRRPGTLTLITMMDDARLSRALAGERGALFFPGMRAGRVDDVILIDYPNPTTRAAILRAHAADRGVELPNAVVQRIADQTEGWSGAYLREVVVRIQFYGVDALDREMRKLRMLVPPPQTPPAPAPPVSA